MTVPDWISATRLGLVVLLWPAAIAGQGRLVGIGLVLAAVSDAVDGYLARRMGCVSIRGARLDALADSALMLSAGAWLAILHPTLLGDNAPVLAAAGALYAASTAASYLAFGRLVDPRQLSAKVAGALLYGFALVTFLTGSYEPILLRIALLALAASCVEGFMKAIRTIQVSAIASKPRSHKPHASNGVMTNTAAATSIASSAHPATRQILP